MEHLLLGALRLLLTIPIHRRGRALSVSCVLKHRSNKHPRDIDIGAELSALETKGLTAIP